MEQAKHDKECKNQIQYELLTFQAKYEELKLMHTAMEKIMS